MLSGQAANGIIPMVSIPTASPVPVVRACRLTFFLGWAPQQILAWTGLLRYGFDEEAERLAYKWLYMVVSISRACDCRSEQNP